MMYVKKDSGAPTDRGLVETLLQKFFFGWSGLIRLLVLLNIVGLMGIGITTVTGGNTPPIVSLTSAQASNCDCRAEALADLKSKGERPV